MKAFDAINRLAEITAYQWGMFTSAQAKRAGIARYTLVRLENHGQIERLLHGVYRIAAVPTDEYEELRAIWLKFLPDLYAYERMEQLATDFVVAGQTAAILHEMADYRMDRFEFIHDGRKQTRQAQAKVRNRSFDTSDVMVVTGLPVTSREVTYRDLIDAHEDVSSVRYKVEE